MRLILLLGPLLALGCAPYHTTVSGDQLLADVTRDDGDGVDGDADQCPRAREDIDGFKDDDGCPDADNDGDGWVDAADACPDEAGGPRSTDGCVPFIDDDNDGVEDSGDQCLGQAETKNGHRDDDGCPDVAVSLSGDRIAFGEPVVLFTPGAVDLAEGAELALSEIAWLLSKHPEITGLEVGAHVEAVGSTRAATKLTQAQADAVVAALVQLGVAEGRLSAKGYGRSQPVASGSTEEAHAQNRRVEFKVTSRQ
ncbi:MAG: OmpA family protein [Alphaproteobacteria bacterium]|nr:OmpA family protein [Alphaproteobacteria bacterium]MCB9795858.1 OmpA family protein [Alphaproteobacteria bacterium]